MCVLLEYCNTVQREEPRRKSRGMNDDVVVYYVTLKAVLSRTKITMLRNEKNLLVLFLKNIFVENVLSLKVVDSITTFCKNVVTQKKIQFLKISKKFGFFQKKNKKLQLSK
jgi:hypothetical protein